MFKSLQFSRGLFNFAKIWQRVEYNVFGGTLNLTQSINQYARADTLQTVKIKGSKVKVTA